MSKLVAFTAFAAVCAVAVAIASLVINIIILNNTNTINTNTKATPAPVTVMPTATTTTIPTTTTASSYICAKVSNSTGFANAAQQLLQGIDLTVDPCQDFYAFTCNKYLAGINLTALGLSRKGTYDDSQANVNQFVYEQVKAMNINDASISKTEQATKIAIEQCVNAPDFSNYSASISQEITNLFGGVPFLGGALKADLDFFAVHGAIEQTHALGLLMSSWVSVDYQQIAKNALYISQPALNMPRDFFVKPQFIDQLTDQMEDIQAMMTVYAQAIGQPYDNIMIAKAAEDVTNFMVQMALASWPDEEQRNYKLQYNRYLVNQLSTIYQNIQWDSYLDNLLQGVQNASVVKTDGLVISQPSYFGWLNSVFQGNTTDMNTVANYMIVQMLFDDYAFLPEGNHVEILKRSNYVPYAQRRGKGLTRIGRRTRRRFDDKEGNIVGCVDLVMAYFLYGPGYVYVKGQDSKVRDAASADINKQTNLIISNFQKMMGTLTWMSNSSYSHAIEKSNSICQNYGWPSLFGKFTGDFANLDDYNEDYMGIITSADYYTTTLILKKGLEVREAFKLLNQQNEAGCNGWGRLNFLQSPAEVNAWYQPERNSITFPYAAWNPPYYNLEFPQAYNFAGQGGTGGHELTHGFDDEGVQFDSDGSLSDCTWASCGWMDSSSSDGFTNMAQCVVSQYSTQCCPEKTGNVHCANGATTQGENIADLGGQQAAYYAYQQWVSENGMEDRLPGLEQFTPNQIFWITYGFSWCMAQTDSNLVNQLLTNPHAPAKCRTNQVMQDIPSFGVDFKCTRGSPMFPEPDQRCMVWVGN